MKSLYLVQKVHTQVTIGKSLPMPLVWAEGMVGAFPLFETRQAAVIYADGNEDVVIEVNFE